MTTRAERRQLLVLMAAVLAITAAVFQSSFANQFLNWDDPYNVVQNAAIRGITWDHARTYFTQPLMGMYSPLVYLSYAMDFAMGGFNPSVYHTTNLLLHLLNTTLVGLIVFALLEPVRTPDLKVGLYDGRPDLKVGLYDGRPDVKGGLYDGRPDVKGGLHDGGNDRKDKRRDLKGGLYGSNDERRGVKVGLYDGRADAGRVWAAVIVAALFALHPANVAAVAPISVRSSLLYSAFYLTAYWTYLRYLARPSAARLVLTFALFVCAGLSKSAAMVFPLLMLATDFYRARRWTTASLIEKAPFLIVSVIFGLVTLHYRDDVAVGSAPAFSMLERAAVAGYGVMHYVRTLLVPSRLSAYYPYPGRIDGHLPMAVSLAPLFVVVLAAAAWLWKAERRLLLFGGAFFLLHIALILKIVPLGEEFAADRYLYLASIGIFFILVELVRQGSATMQRAGLSAAALVLVVFGVAAHARIGAWHDSVAFYDDILAKYPQAAFAYTNRAAARLTEDQDAAGAVRDCDLAIKADPSYADAYFNRGTAEMLLRRFTDARADAGMAVTLAGDRRQYYQLRAEARLALGDAQGASDDSTRAIALAPQAAETAKAYLSRGVARISLNDTAGAADDFTHAIAIDPLMSPAYQNRGNARALLNDSAGAIADFTKTIELDPGAAAAFYTRALLRARAGDRVGACTDLVAASNLGRTDARLLAQQLCK